MNTSSSQYAFILTLLLGAIMLNTSTCTFNTRCNKKEEQALLNFKQGLVDPSSVLSSWSTRQDCCEWKGVTCDNITSRVTQLNLYCYTTLPTYIDKTDKSHCLAGSIYLSSLLVELEFLNDLDLSNNDFLGFHFDSMYIQNCHNLSLTTPPPHHCVNSSALRYLDLSGNENLVISGLQWLSHLPSLEYIDLSNINLQKETNWLQLMTTLPSLSVLVMRSCKLEGLSPSLQYANFTSLEVLDLSFNEFNSEIPIWLFNLSSPISDVHLFACSLKGQVPKALLNLRHLEVLVLAYNNFSGSIPDWLGEIQHLKTLMLLGNMFSGSIPINLGNLSSLTTLVLGENQLTGVVSERNFAKLSKLKGLHISLTPPLIFDFDSHWVPPFQLERFVFGFAGRNIPAWLYTQRSIKFLTIFGSSFKAPGKFWNFVSGITTELNLEGNSIDANLSNVLLNSSFTTLSSSFLKGKLPRISSNVAVLKLSNNSLTGNISPLLCDPKMRNRKNKLMFLDLSMNHLSGGLTNCWENWKSLVVVNLGSNNLRGKIPPSMGLLSNLTSLHLHENKLYGEIPSTMQNFRFLLIFNVRENNLSGNIPNWIAHSAMALQIRSNRFSGNIPIQICEMSSLIVLDIADNEISGHIPTCLHNIKALAFNNASMNKLTFYFPIEGSRYLIVSDSLELVTKGQVSKYDKNLHFVTLIDMSSNNLSGTIPPQIFSLTGLFSLNFSHNKLTGKIPSEIASMTHLESLDFSTNQLWGELPQGLSSLSFLSYLNLSFNNFRGKIPSGTQLQGFGALSYMGNPDLCGPPLTKICFHDKFNDTKPLDEDKGESEFMQWFYIGMGSGFGTGYLGVCCAIFFNKRWRHAYFKFLYDMRDRVYVMVVIKMNSIR